MINIQKQKKDSFSEALKYSLSINDNIGNEIGKLIPIDNWALNDKNLLSSFASWRKKFSHFFFTTFKTSAQSTKTYLKNVSIAQTNRILFCVYFDNNLIGHMGLSEISSREALLDNFIRGESGGHSNLMYFAEKTLISWAFEELMLEKLLGRMMSNNFLANSLHESFGFKLQKRLPLKKVITKNSFTFEECEKVEATEKFYLDIIELNKSSFKDIVKNSKI